MNHVVQMFCTDGPSQHEAYRSCVFGINRIIRWCAANISTFVFLNNVPLAKDKSKRVRRSYLFPS